MVRVTGRAMDELLDRAPCGFVSFGDDGIILAVNATLAERLRYSTTSLIGRHVETILTVAGRIFYQTHFFPLVKMHGRAQELFILLQASDGEQIGALCNAVRHERDGAPANDCVLLEVQERRKFEEALLHARQAADRANVVLAQRHRELEETNAQLVQANALLEEQAIELETQQEELQVLTEELRQQSAELERQRAAADDANRAKSSYLAAMSHELRTPLNAIGGYLQLLELGVHGPIPDAQHAVLKRIDRSQRHLLGLINAVLDLSKIEAGRVEYRVDTLAVADVLHTVIPMVEPQAQARELRLEASVPAPLRFRGDRDKVQQILINLLGNAIKFTPPRGAVRVEAGDDGTPGMIEVRISDTGMGIPADMLERIFMPFVQLESVHGGTGQGTGLGLAISRNFARGMGGDLTAASTVGSGSTFTLTLPSAP